MGGCRCIFRNCSVNSSSYPGMHFFHFPIKQKEKLNLWIKYAKAEHILNLTPNQMKNKVVCNTHFRDECFMNYKKDRLTREAVPTLIRLGQPNMVLDYEKSDNPKPTKLPETTAKHLLPPANDKSEEDVYLEALENTTSSICGKSCEILPVVDICNSLFEIEKELPQNKSEDMDTEQLDKCSSNIEQPSPKRQKRFKSPPKILNRNAMPIIQQLKITNRRNNTPTTSPRKKTFIINGTKSTKNYKNTKKMEKNGIDYIDGNYVSVINNLSDIIQIDNDHNTTLIDKIVNLDNKDAADNWQKQKLDYEMQIEQLQNKVKAKDEILKVIQIETVSTSKQNSKLQTSQPKQLTKGQLFNGIKKYLCPSMSALVRMEMFSEPERDWKSDEKQASIELLQLGDPVFHYFRDEWRLRLPPKKEVEKWISISGNNNDDEEL